MWKRRKRRKEGEKERKGKRKTVGGGREGVRIGKEEKDEGKIGEMGREREGGKSVVERERKVINEKRTFHY